MKLLNIIDRERKLEDLDLLLYFYKSETRKCCNEIAQVTNLFWPAFMQKRILIGLGVSHRAHNLSIAIWSQQLFTDGFS